MAIVTASLGCGTESQPTPTATSPPATENRVADTTPPTPAPVPSPPITAVPTQPPAAFNPPTQPRVATPSIAEAELLFGSDDPSERLPPKPTFDDGKIRAAGIRKLESKHLVLYTDLPAEAGVDEFPAVFDKAIPIWCEYFEIEPSKAADWQMFGCVIEQKNRFAGAGLFPNDLPDFPHGYHRDWQFWVYEQPSEYYARHLVLHEGTHAFMKAFLGNAGPPWFMEGMAEYLGTHRWENEQLTLGYMPLDNDEVPFWGRVKIIADDFAANRGQTLENVMAFGPQAHIRTEAYAWSWAAVTFLAEHPRSADAFKGMLSHVNLGTKPFADKLKHDLADIWPQLEEDWQLLVMNIDYGYDVRRNAITFAPGQPIPAEGVEVEISAEHGWQSSGYQLRSGRKYQITAKGQYVIGTEPKPWTCEPGGVTIRYHNGQPLGKLLGALRADAPPAGSYSALATPAAVGLAMEVNPDYDGVLYFTINEHPAEWEGNEGTLTVRIEPVEE